ncbi:MAG: helix-turn-helix transcriptional regulator, partial [Desulfobacterales bacterium]|nr:helix-turn-helix transcriptional regulator [Desulfobacterales bacterium]
KTVNTKTGASAILSFPGSRIKHATTHPLTDDRGRLQGVLKIDTDITDRKQDEAELDLRVHVKKLEEKNIALNVLLETRDDQRHQIADTIWQNFDRLVFPYHEKLREGRPKDLDTLVKILEKNTIESLAPLEKAVSARYRNFTPMEIQVADLVKLGKTSKEIAGVLNISERSVFFHRNNIRKKLDIHKTSVNLRTRLMGM